MALTDLVRKCTNVHTVIALFSREPEEITQATEQYIMQARSDVAHIIAVPAAQRTYENTFGALDRLSSISDLKIMSGVCSVAEIAHPDEYVRNAAHDAVIIITQFFTEQVTNNKALFDVLSEYASQHADKESLSDEQAYFIQETLRDFTSAGIHLPADQRTRIVALHNEITQLNLDFEQNIAQEDSIMIAGLEELHGVDANVLDSLKKNEEGAYILGTDYPTAHAVLEDCLVENTRKAMWHLFDNRAYPVNESLLTRLIAARSELAALLGHKTYAHYELEHEMVKTPEHAHQFLSDLAHKAQAKADQELAHMTQQLPEGATLSPDGRIKAWDMRYVQTQYKKNHYAVDEQEIAQYFPMEHTIQGLLAIYRVFFDIDFQEIPVNDTWHRDVRVIAVYTANHEKLLGYLLMDLFPRPNKFSHAAHFTVVPAVQLSKDFSTVHVSVMFANFPKETSETPSLLKRSDVETFFHEFGHAIHAVLGKTTVGSFSGTSTKTDFVELPSQMLEEWLWNKDILRELSCHYETGEHLPDDVLEKIIHAKHVDTGLAIKRQIFFSLASLELYGQTSAVIPAPFWNDLYKKMIPYLFTGGEELHAYTSFGHLTDYGARYYAYLWSNVFALDVFETIKEGGLLNPAMGKRYLDAIISKGGSKDPNELLRDFLGREPNNKAFLKDLGL